MVRAGAAEMSLLWSSTGDGYMRRQPAIMHE